MSYNDNDRPNEDQTAIRASTLLSGLAGGILIISGWLFSLVIQAQRDNTAQVSIMAVNQGKLETRLLAHMNMEHRASEQCEAVLKLMERRAFNHEFTPLD